MPDFEVRALNPEPVPVTISCNSVTTPDGVDFIVLTICTAAGINHAWVPKDAHMQLVNEILRAAKTPTANLIVPTVNMDSVMKDINGGKRN